MLTYGACLGYGILSDALQKQIGGSKPWSEDLPWLDYFQLLGYAISDDIRVGTMGFFALLTMPMSSGMFLYHVYLIWAGMTTNESSKWGDWRDDISNGLAYRAKASDIYPAYDDDYLAEPSTSWPTTSDQTLVYTDHGEPPRIGYVLTNDRISIIQPRNSANSPPDPRWTRVKSLKEVTNLYDLGFWENLQDSLGLSEREGYVPPNIF